MINCGESVKNASMRASWGGLVKDDRGNFLYDFAGNFGACKILVYELWSIYYGLKLV